MIKDIKIILLVIFIIISLTASFLFFTLRNSAKGQRLSVEDQLTKIRVSKDKASEELSRLKQDRDGVKNNIERLRKEASSLEAELAKQKGNIESIRNKMTHSERESIQANRKIEQTVLSIEELRKGIANIVRDTLSIREELTLLEKTKVALEDRFKQYSERETAESKTITEQEKEQPEPAQAATASKPGMEGEVLTVNREFDFVVVSLGKNDGMEEGMVFDVLRDDMVVGQVEIETVRTNISAASLVNKEAISQMRAGDKISPAFTG